MCSTQCTDPARCHRRAIKPLPTAAAAAACPPTRTPAPAEPTAGVCVSAWQENGQPDDPAVVVI